MTDLRVRWRCLLALLPLVAYPLLLQLAALTPELRRLAALTGLLQLAALTGLFAGDVATPELRRVGIVGFGKLGRFLVHKLQNDGRANGLELAFVWNRDHAKLASLPKDLRLQELSLFAAKRADLIVEVAHPDITASHGADFLTSSDYFVGSPSAFASPGVDGLARSPAHALYVPAGALWGAEDIQKMANTGTLRSLEVTMKKHPASLKVLGHLVDTVKECPRGEECVVFEGSVRGVCPLAPNNVNTMACAALAAHNLGFDGTKARLVADDRLDAHVIVVNATGPASQNGAPAFNVVTERLTPAAPGAVTGVQTLASFWSSLLRARGQPPGLHFC
jgi:predicted dinucleotide-utilizing enzyme